MTKSRYNFDKVIFKKTWKKLVLDLEIVFYPNFIQILFRFFKTDFIQNSSQFQTNSSGLNLDKNWIKGHGQ